MTQTYGLRGPLAEHIELASTGVRQPDGSMIVSLRFNRMGCFTAKMAQWLADLAAALPPDVTLNSADTTTLVRLFLDDVPPTEAAARLTGELGA